MGRALLRSFVFCIKAFGRRQCEGGTGWALPARKILGFPEHRVGSRSGRACRCEDPDLDGRKHWARQSGLRYLACCREDPDPDGRKRWARNVGSAVACCRENPDADGRFHSNRRREP